MNTPTNLVSDDYAERVCKIGQGHECCRYLTMGGAGFACAKLTALRHTLDARGDSMVARGDNCDGLPLDSDDKDYTDEQRDAGTFNARAD